MILAAGKGTRMEQITESIPKALVKVNGITMLEICIRKLATSGFDKIIINVYHFADQILEFLKINDNFGLNISISHEKELLNTGGAIKHAKHLFTPNEPILIHNVDALSTLDLKVFYSEQTKSDNIATLGTRERKTNRYLLFDENLILSGWEKIEPPQKKLVRFGFNTVSRRSFMGIYVISPEFLIHFPKETEFSIIDYFLSLASKQFQIKAKKADDCLWNDVGTPEKLQKAEEAFTIEQIRQML